MVSTSKASDQAPVGSEYRVSLDHFAGPMDLLLHLIKKEEVDIHDIPISRILGQYMKHLEIIKDLDLDDAGDFLVMAATLMVVKSRMLLPAEEVDLGEEIDPRFELVQQLLEYKKIKDASAGLVSRSREFARRVGRPETARPEPIAPEDRFLDDVALFDLLEAFGRVMESIGTDAGKKDRRVRVDDIPVREYVASLGKRIQNERSVTFSELLRGCRDRGEAVGYFLAILLLLKHGSIAAAQGGHCGDIRLYHRSDAATSDVEVDLADDFH